MHCQFCHEDQCAFVHRLPVEIMYERDGEKLTEIIPKTPDHQNICPDCVENLIENI